MDFVLRQPIPYKSLDFIYSVLDIHYNVSQKRKWRQLRPLYAILALKGIHFLFLVFYKLPLTALQLIAHDLIGLNNLPAKCNLIIIGALLLSAYYNYLNIIQPHITVDFFAQVMRGKKSTLLISEFRPNGKPVTPYIKKFCFLVLSSLQVFILAVGKFKIFIFLNKHILYF